MKLRTEIIWEHDGCSPGFLFDPRYGDVLVLNETARLVLEGLEHGLGPDALVAEFTRKHEVSELAARCDIDAFLNLLLEKGLVC